jgi:hypothetical protein
MGSSLPISTNTRSRVLGEYCPGVSPARIRKGKFIELAEQIRRQQKKTGFRRDQYGREIAYPKPGVLDWLQVQQGPLPYGILAFVVLLWLISLPLVNLNNMTDIGLLAVLPIFFYAALLVLTISFCVLAYHQPLRNRLLLLHLTTLIAMFHATPAILYGTLRYSWAWKHVGLVDYIQRFGSVNTDIDALNAYHNWPGFFALNALLTEAAGLDSALAYAPWASLFFNLLFLGALLLIYRSMTTDRRLVWTAAWFFFLANWVGQDYFAPQSFVFVFYLLIVGILLYGFRLLKPPSEGRLRRWLRFPRLSRFFYSIFLHSAFNASEQPPPLIHRMVLMGVLLLFMVVITFTHQLTPIMAVIALAFLTIFQLIYTRGLTLLMAVLAAAWIWLFATDFMGENLRSVLSSFGAIESNVSENLINLELASTGQIVVALMGRGLTVLVMLLAGIGYIRRLRNGHFDLAALLMVIAPFFLLLANSYGGEILFRIYFFAVPFMAFFIAGLIYPRNNNIRSWKAPAAAAALSLIMLVGFLFSYYGKEKQYYFSAGEVSAAKYLYNTAPPGSLIVEGSRNYPSLFRNYEQFTYVPMNREPEDSRLTIIDDPVVVMERWMSNPEYPAAYLIITRSMKAENDMVGIMPSGSFNIIESKLEQSGRFEVLYSDPDAKIYTLKERRP